MTDILFTDTHFGTRNHSLVWFRYQKSFIYDQLIPEIKKQQDVRVIHLGDVFDSRSGVNTYIAAGVRQMFLDIANLDNVKEIIILAGNHDFYSPVSDECCTIETLLYNIPKTKLVTKHIYETDTEAFIPWYEMERLGLDHLPNKVIYTHTDITEHDFSKPVYSGHIHYPKIKGNSRNLGSCYPLTFSDYNDQRYFYIKKDQVLAQVPNKCCIHFWRFYDEELFNSWVVGIDDYIELYVSQQNLEQEQFRDRIVELKKQYKNLWIIPVKSDVIIAESIDINLDMDSIITSFIPEDLMDKFNILKQSVE